MQKKDLRSLGVKPGLVTHYESAIQKVFGIRTQVPSKYIPNFIVMEKELDDAGISPMDYTDVVVTSLRAWTKERKLRCLPIHIFLSEFAVNTYKRVKKFSSVRISKNDLVSIKQEDMLVLRHALTTKQTYEDALSSLKPMLSKEFIAWSMNNTAPSIDTLMDMADELDSKDVSIEGLRAKFNG